MTIDFFLIPVKSIFRKSIMAHYDSSIAIVSFIYRSLIVDINMYILNIDYVILPSDVFTQGKSPLA